MVFVIWFFAWIALAELPVHILLPALALTIRIAYVERHFPKFPPAVIVFWLMLAAFTAIGSGGTQQASVLFLQVFVSTLAIFHFFDRIKTSRTLRSGKLGQLYFFLTRALVVVGARGREIAYWFRTRIRLSDDRLMLAYARLAPSAAGAYLLEMIAVRNRFSTVIEAKGGYPEDDEWLFGPESGRTWIFTMTGDVITLAVIAVAGLIHHSSLVPPRLEHFLGL